MVRGPNPSVPNSKMPCAIVEASGVLIRVLANFGTAHSGREWAGVSLDGDHLTWRLRQRVCGSKLLWQS